MRYGLKSSYGEVRGSVKKPLLIEAGKIRTVANYLDLKAHTKDTIITGGHGKQDQYCYYGGA